MAIVKFLGRVIPDRGLNITQIPTHTLKYPSGFEATLETTVENSAVTVECEVERFDHAIFEPLHLHVLQITRPSVVDLVSFESGSGFTTVLEKFIGPDGTIATIQSADPTLNGICSIPAQHLFEISGDLQVSMILHWLTSTLAQPYLWQINCHLAVEGIGRLVSPNEDDTKRRWLNLRAALNLSEDYVHLISEASKGPRHANLVDIFSTTIEVAEARKRSWTIMNRFLEYRRRKVVSLPEDEFPRL
jgi:hypothetical protein